uniref:Thyroxine-binding globulin n=1 Tax=Sphaeramia orbicularis TaxID=375764 RepID=A0A672YAW6_9TELE
MANKDFALRLYTNLANHADSQGKNIFFSPVSVSVALAALSVGARGETHEQLFTGLGFNMLHLPFTNSYSMRYEIFIPKFSIKTSYSLKDVLSQMGMTDMFGDKADLSGISEGQKLVVSKIVHHAALDVDEVGATAAAATGIEITLTSLLFIPVLKFNRPFMVLITERNTEDILFMGKIINPTI